MAPSKSKTDLAYARAQWLLTEPGSGPALDFTIRRDAHSISPNPLDRLPPEIIARRHVSVLDLRQTKVADLSSLSSFTDLEVARLDGSDIADISPLRNCLRLKELNLSRTRVRDIQAVANFPGLQELTFIGTSVSDLSPLRGLKQLKTLWISNTEVSSLEPISELESLESLWIENTKVTDLSPLANLSALRQIHLSHSPIRSLAPLARLVKLVEASEHSRSSAETFGIEFSGCPIEEDAVCELHSARNPERTRRVINYYRSLAGLDPVGNWEADLGTASTDAKATEAPSQSDSAVKFLPTSDGLIDIAPPSATSHETGVLRSEVVRKADALAKKCPETSNDDAAEIRQACRLVVSLLQSEAGNPDASAAAIWSYTSTLRSKLRADHRRQKLTAEERERLLEEPPLLIGLSEDLSDLISTIERFAAADADLGPVEQQEPSAEEQASAARALDRGGRSLAKSAIDHAALVTSRTADVLRPIAEGAMPGAATIGGKREVVEVETINNFVIVAVNEALPRAQERLENTPDTEATSALKRISSSLEKSNRPKSVIESAREGAGQALGTVAVAKGEAALTWLVQNADKVLAVISTNPGFRLIVQAVQWLIRLFS